MQKKKVTMGILVVSLVTVIILSGIAIFDVHIIRSKIGSSGMTIMIQVRLAQAITFAQPSSCPPDCTTTIRDIIHHCFEFSNNRWKYYVPALQSMFKENPYIEVCRFYQVALVQCAGQVLRNNELDEQLYPKLPPQCPAYCIPQRDPDICSSIAMKYDPYRHESTWSMILRDCDDVSRETEMRAHKCNGKVIRQ